MGACAAFAVDTPSASSAGAAPSDAIVLFDGRNLDEWISTYDLNPRALEGSPAGIGDGREESRRSSIGGDSFETTSSRCRGLDSAQDITGEGQARGNSGLSWLGPAGGDAGVLRQNLDTDKNATYVNGQAASVYKQ